MSQNVSFENMKISFLKEIGFPMGFVARKSQKIGKIENMVRKRHLLIFSSFRFLVFLLPMWNEIKVGSIWIGFKKIVDLVSTFQQSIDSRRKEWEFSQKSVLTVKLSFETSFLTFSVSNSLWQFSNRDFGAVILCYRKYET